MTLVVFAAPEGNPWALEAVLSKAKRLSATEVVCLGSAVGKGPDPARTVELLRKRGVVLVRGAHDDAALGRAPALALRELGDVNARALAPADLAYLKVASPPRRMRVGPSHVLLSADSDADGRADLVVRPGARTGASEDGRIVTLGAPDAATGELPILVIDEEAGVRIDHLAWDADALRVAARTHRA